MDYSEVQEAAGRETRARTRLIVEGFSNLALVAILFSGVQAQIIAITNTSNTNQLDIATNAVFFGGLVFSVFTAVLASLSGRWFSILREDDSDYLTSRWLEQDALAMCKTKTLPNSTKLDEELEDYLQYQISLLRRKIAELEKPRPNSCSGTTTRPDSGAIVEPRLTQPSTPTSPGVSQRNNPSYHRPSQPNAKESPSLSIPPNPIIKDFERTIELLQAELKSDNLNLRQGPTTMREDAFRWILLSPIGACTVTLTLFCAGILMLVWNKQPRAVAVFTSFTVLVCVLLLFGFGLRHRHKHVIKRLLLTRCSV